MNKEETVQDVLKTYNEEQLAVLELMKFLSRININQRSLLLNKRYIKKVIKSLDKNQKDVFYYIIGREERLEFWRKKAYETT